MMIRRFDITKKKALGICLAVVALLLCWTSLAQAHAFLLRSEPSDNSVLIEPPTEIKLWFNEPTVPQFNSVQLLDIHGNLHTLTDISSKQGDPNLLVYTPEVLSEGVYTVNWTVISAADGHISNGYFVFRVDRTTAGSGEQGGNTGLVVPGGDSQVDQKTTISSTLLPDILLRWSIFLGLIILTGAAGMLTFVLRPPIQGEVDSENSAEMRQSAAVRLLKLGLIAAGVLSVITILQLAWQMTSVVKSSSISGYSFQSIGLLLATPWGYAWLTRQVLLAIVLGIFFYKNKTKTPWGLSLRCANFFILGMLLTQSMMSHAAAAPNPAVPVLVDFLHLLFVGLWIGGLFGLCVGLLPILRKQRAAFDQLTRAVWGPFSRIAVVSVAMVIATGIYSTGQRVASADALLLTPYGKALSAKVSLMLAVGILGLINSMILHPKLAAPLARLLKKPVGWSPVQISQFSRFVLIEAVLGIGVVMMVGILTALPPAKGVEFLLPEENQIDNMVEPVNDLVVDLSIKPNQPGANLFTINVLNSRRPPPAETLRVIVRTTYLEQDFGVNSQDAVLVSQDRFQDSYRLSGNLLSQPGRWKIEVVVRRKGLPDSLAAFQWTVMPIGGYHPPLLSRYPWRGAMTWISLLLMVSAFLGIVYILRRGYQAISR